MLCPRLCALLCLFLSDHCAPGVMFSAGSEESAACWSYVPASPGRCANSHKVTPPTDQAGSRGSRCSHRSSPEHGGWPDIRHGSFSHACTRFSEPSLDAAEFGGSELSPTPMRRYSVIQLGVCCGPSETTSTVIGELYQPSSQRKTPWCAACVHG